MPVYSLGITQVRALGRDRNFELALQCVLLKYNLQVCFLFLTDLHPKGEYYEYYEYA